MVIRRAVQFFVIFPAMLFLLNFAFSLTLWLSHETSPRIDAEAMFRTSIVWLVAYVLFMAPALRRSGHLYTLAQSLVFLLLCPLAAAPTLVVSQLLADFFAAEPIAGLGELAIGLGLWTVIGYAYALLAVCVVWLIHSIGNWRGASSVEHGP